MLTLGRYVLLMVSLLLSPLVCGENMAWESLFSTGIAYRQQGNLQLSINQFAQAKLAATTVRDKMRATGELGASLLQARRLDQAEVSLREAYTFFTDTERALYAIDLGNLEVIRKHPEEAQVFYQEAIKAAGTSSETGVSARLNSAKLLAPSKRLGKLNGLFEDIGNVQDKSSRARFYLNLGNQARELGAGASRLAYQSFDEARRLSARQDDQLQVESLDALAQYNEDKGRVEDALNFNRQAIAKARSLDSGVNGDVIISLEWRQGRLQKIQKHNDLALAAYQRAVDQIELLRQDIPIEYEDGRSSFHSTFEPIYLGTVDLLLQQAAVQTESAQEASLRRAGDVVELIKQSELQDYLGDRCTVESVKGGSVTVIPAGTAVLYPIIYQDRIELLLETNSGIVHFATKVQGSNVRKVAVEFAANLRNGDEGYLPLAQQLYSWMLRPLEGALAEKNIGTLVVVPDGALRLVPMGALHDGKNFVIEKLAITTVTGLSMTNTNAPPVQGVKFLIAGVSEPGSVVDKLSPAIVAEILGTDVQNKQSVRGLGSSRSTRSLKFHSGGALLGENTKSSKGDVISRSSALRESLSLPGVKEEIEAISRILPSTKMLNADFTVDGFREEAESGSYRILHVATHGIFGGSGDASYILAYDNLLTLNGLQDLLKSDNFRKNPIELLTMSACQTAEGDDRSPLGISGAAIKARAKSVMGTLWPVDDMGARKMMETFYRGLSSDHLSKAEAQRRAQVELLHSEGFAHPFYWAPFVLIGNWL